MTTATPHVGNGDEDKHAPRTVDRRAMLAGGAFLTAATAAPAWAQTVTCPEQAAPRADADVEGIWWNELVTSDPKEAQKFYEKVTGWTPKIVALDDTSRPPLPGETEYTVFVRKGHEVAGLLKLDDKDPKSPKAGWLSYIEVDSVDEAVTAALKHGGKVLKFPVDVPKVGRLAVIEDPLGNSVGLVTPIANAPG